MTAGRPDAGAPGRQVCPGDRAARARRAASVGLLLALAAGLLACRDDPAPADRTSPRSAAPRAPAPAPTPRDERLEACVEERLRGPGYDELAARDARRKLRRLQVRAECEARPGR